MEEKITIKTIDKLCDLSKLNYNLEEKEKLDNLGFVWNITTNRN